MLNIVPEGKTSSDLVFGLAFLDKDGSGRYGDVFFNRVAAAQRAFGADVSQLLGSVAAHELGHLLLGSHAHASSGIMSAVWTGDVLRHMEMGVLLFTREQASLKRTRIRGERVSLASVGLGESDSDGDSDNAGRGRSGQRFSKARRGF
jgi:hypothetical protein